MFVARHIGGHGIEKRRSAHSRIGRDSEKKKVSAQPFQAKTKILDPPPHKTNKQNELQYEEEKERSAVPVLALLL